MVVIRMQSKDASLLAGASRVRIAERTRRARRSTTSHPHLSMFLISSFSPIFSLPLLPPESCPLWVCLDPQKAGKRVTSDIVVYCSTFRLFVVNIVLP